MSDEPDKSTSTARLICIFLSMAVMVYVVYLAFEMVTHAVLESATGHKLLSLFNEPSGMFIGLCALGVINAVPMVAIGYLVFRIWEFFIKRFFTRKEMEDAFYIIAVIELGPFYYMMTRLMCDRFFPDKK